MAIAIACLFTQPLSFSIPSKWTLVLTIVDFSNGKYQHSYSR